MKLMRAGVLVAIALLQHAPLTAQRDATLFGQSAQATLDRLLDEQNYGNRTEYLLMNARTRKVVAARWAGQGEPVAAGSLMKPFVALAYAGGHGERFPGVLCQGRADGCWRVAGHGRIGLRAAVAGSCNAYFLSLAKATSGEAMSRVAVAFGMPRPPEGSSGEDWIGLTGSWKVSPVALAAAYAQLGVGGDDTVATELLAGMRLAASSGTAAGVGGHRGDVLAKTGTAPCRARGCTASGDGLVVAMVPASEPRLVLLVRQRGATGALAAEVAGRMLDRLEEFGGRRW